MQGKSRHPHVDRIGVEMNGDYVDALLRLLAGERGLLLLESEHALRELRDELDSSNPNTGLYREFAAVDVRLGAAGEEGAAFWEDAPAEEETEEETLSVADLAPSDDDTEPDFAPEAETMADEASPKASPSDCPWCRAELPQRDNLNFCPFCGTDVHLVPCPGCGEELEPDWRFCIACGTEVSD